MTRPMERVPKRIGVGRGRVPTDPPSPLPPLPAIDFSLGRRVGSGGRPIDDVVRELVDAAVLHGAREEDLLRRVEGEWRPVVRLMSSDLMDENISPTAFVAFVMGRLRRRGRATHLGHLFSMKHFPSWLGQYRAHGGGSIDAGSYEATPERRRLHSERVRSRLA